MTAAAIYVKVTLEPPVPKLYQSDSDEEIKPIKVKVDFNFVTPLKIVKVETKKKESYLDTDRLR